jgi:hypothetical protein
MQIESGMTSLAAVKVPNECQTAGAAREASYDESGHPGSEVYIPWWCVPPKARPDERPDQEPDSAKHGPAGLLERSQERKCAQHDHGGDRKGNDQTERE